MKNTQIVALAAVLMFALYDSRSQSLTNASNQLGTGTEVLISTNYLIVSRGPHYRVMQYQTVGTNFIGGRTIIRTNSHTYTEIATGMHRKNGQGEWIETSDEVLPATGGAAATNTAHQVFFSANANSTEALRVAMPDGSTTVTSHVLCLSYFDSKSGSNAIIAELHDSTGQIITANEILYTNAFLGDCSADILYRNSRAGIEQNIIFRTQPPAPSSYGISNAMLQVWTEIVSGPTPTAYSSVDASGLTDEQLDFGLMKIGRGAAFLIGSTESPHVRVLKQWLQTEGRTFLIEQVPVDAITAQLEQLPVSGGGGGGFGPHGSIRRRLPNVRFARATTNAIQTAKIETKQRPGFLLDYNLTSSTNFVFQADTTYYVSGTVRMSGSNVFEGGCVIKYATNASIVIDNLYGTPSLNCFASAYRPITITAKDDRTIGDIISGSANIPSGYYANPAFSLSGLSPQVPSLAHVRFAYAQQGLLLDSSADISDAQFVTCVNPFQADAAIVHLRNALITACQTNVLLYNSSTVTAEHVTFSGSSCLAASSASPTGGVFLTTNCILANVTNLMSGAVTVDGGTNGFWNSPTYGNIVTNLFYPFQTVGAGAFYLSSDCVFRNAGTPNINSSLLARLAQETTYPPIVISNTILAADMALNPQAQRDTDTPDLGYHYDPIDYAFNTAAFTNATLTLSPGVAISSAGQYGISLWSGSQFISAGTATNLNHVVRYNTVQENSNTNWDGKGESFLDDWNVGPTLPRFSASFTDFATSAQDNYHLKLTYSGGNVFFANCQLHAGKLYAGQPNINLTNSLLERVNSIVSDDSGTLSPTIRNCLFFGGSLYLGHLDSGTWFLRDNLFDRAALSQDGDMDAAYNAYSTNSTRLTPTNAHDIVLTSADYRSGPLGSYYYPTNGGNLSGLINAGSTTADLVGLYHYTVTTNLVSGLQIKETNSIVDIGFHYVATDGSGNPIDTDGDGIPDYLEDANGNGSVDSGETDWQSAADLGLKVIITRPRSGNSIP